jgi:hypothetical protein
MILFAAVRNKLRRGPFFPKIPSGWRSTAEALMTYRQVCSIRASEERNPLNPQGRYGPRIRQPEALRQYTS